LPLSLERGAERPRADVGVSTFLNTTINYSYYLVVKITINDVKQLTIKGFLLQLNKH